MHSGEHEKASVALNSVVAAVFLTGMKLGVGLLSGSLGILAEALHSGLDLVAALVTYFAVRFSGKAADQKHPYGHGKMENLSAMFETILLLITCIWIIHEAYDRLAAKHIAVDASIWTFAVMVISIIVDVSRSRMLYAAARKHNSQALEADALHFSTDIWSSAVVLLGLFCVKLSDWFPALSVLQRADALAALGVAVIVIHVSVKLGIRTIEGLLDAAPAGMAENIKKLVEGVAETKDCHSVRVRTSGPKVFIDVHVTLDGNLTLKRAHQVTDQIEELVQRNIPEADITVHPEPYSEPEANPNSSNKPSGSEAPR